MSISANAPGDPGREQSDSGDPNRDPAEDPLESIGEVSSDADNADPADETSDAADSTDHSGGAGTPAATQRRKGGDAGKDVTKRVKQEARASEAAVKGKPRARKSGSSATKTDEPGFFGRIVLFIRQVFAEIRKVVTPSRQELITFSVVVIVFILAMMAYVGVLDFGIGRLVLWVFGN